jgi:hypothetical protein
MSNKTDWADVRKRIQEEVGENLKCHEPCPVCGLGDGVHVAGCPGAVPEEEPVAPTPKAASG